MDFKRERKDFKKGRKDFEQTDGGGGFYRLEMGYAREEGGTR